MREIYAMLSRSWLLLIAASLLAACHGGFSQSGVAFPSGLDTYGGGGALTFSSGDAGTRWSLSSGAPGSLSATTGSSVVYTPPAEVSADQQITLTATLTDGSTTGLTITLHAPSLGLVATPQIWTVGDAAIVLTASPKYTSLTPTWSVSDGGTLSATTGNSVTYTPASVTSATQVVASATVGSHTESVAITVNPAGTQSLSLSNSSVQAGTNNTVTVAAPSTSNALTWSISPNLGFIVANPSGGATYTPPPFLAATTTVTITATDGTSTWLASLTLTASSVVAVTPSFGVTGAAGPTVSLTATVQNGVASNVAWSLSGPGSLSAGSGATVSYIPDSTFTQPNSTAIVTASSGMSVQAVPINLNFASTARFNYPQGIAVDSSGNVYVADSSSSTIRKITPAGVVSTLAGVQGSSGYVDGTGANAEFDNPTGIAADSSGNVYVADTGNNVIRKISSAGMVSTLAGSSAGTSGSADGTGSAASFNSPRGVTVDSSGNVYVADTLNSTIRKISSTGLVSTVAGTAGSPGSTNGTSTSARFNVPASIAVDSGGNLYVADTNNNAIRKISPVGQVTTLAGGTSGSADGAGSAASFNGPSGVAVDSSGNVYVADSSNSTIREITPAGAVTTLAGTAGVTGSIDGMGNAARFNYLVGIAVDSSGYLYVADTYNNTVRTISPGAIVNTLAGSSSSSGSANGSALQRQ